MKKTVLLIGFFCSVLGGAAQNINAYKYIIVPKKFDILKDINQYQLNVLTKLLFEKSGFTAIYNDAFPDDLKFNHCLGLKASLEEDSGMFTTKLKITLKDCKDNIVFTSAEGKSREKDLKTAYQEALRNTFKSITALAYTYTPSKAITPAVTEPVAEKTMQPTATATPEKMVETVKKPLVTTTANVLYAQPVIHGFQLVDSTPKVVYIIQSTGLENVYILKDKNGILYKKETDWILEYYQDDTLVRETVTVKF